ncbi:hypothetical protein [Priestia megaterium]|uniref:hypothetical protein n=1 Tax=Priestia megaterium TaxID=1404 RepID=UPI003CC65E29
MNEQQYIYGRLKFLSDQVEQLTDLFGRQQKLIEQLAHMVKDMQSPEYIRKQAKTAEMIEVAEKIAMIKNMGKNNKF